MSKIVVITGMPGVGKTHLALALAATIGSNCLLLHTDLLKVTLRTLGFAMRGPGYLETRAKIGCIHRLLAVHVDRANRHGYDLIIEGTLAVGFAATGIRYYLLQVSEHIRLCRVSIKPRATRQELHAADMEGYRRLLEDLAPPGVIRLDASLSLSELCAQVSR